MCSCCLSHTYHKRTHCYMCTLYVARKSLQPRSLSGIQRGAIASSLCVPCAEFGVCSAKRESPASGRTEVSPPFTGCSPALFAWPPRDGIQRRLDKRNSLVFPHMRLPVPAGQVQNTAVLQNTCLPAAAPQAHNSQVKNSVVIQNMRFQICVNSLKRAVLQSTLRQSPAKFVQLPKVLEMLQAHLTRDRPIGRPIRRPSRRQHSVQQHSGSTPPQRHTLAVVVPVGSQQKARAAIGMVACSATNLMSQPTCDCRTVAEDADSVWPCAMDVTTAVYKKQHTCTYRAHASTKALTAIVHTHIHAHAHVHAHLRYVFMDLSAAIRKL